MTTEPSGRQADGVGPAGAAPPPMVEHLDRFFTMSHDLMCIAGADGYFKWLNPAWERLLGTPLAELLARPYAEFVHPDDVDRTAAQGAALAGGGTVVAFENRYRCRDGGYRWLSWNATMAPADGLVYAVARDVSAQHDADAAHARLAAIVDGTDDAIVGKTLDGTITSWNRAAERIYGYRSGEAVGRSVAMIVPPDQLDQLAGMLARVAAGEVLKDLSAVRVRKDGTHVRLALTISPIRDPAGAVVGAATIAHDITGLSRAEERLRRLVLGAPDATVIVTSTGTIALANEQMERLFGYSGDELVGQPIDLLVPPEVRGRHGRHRRGYLVNPQFRAMGADLELSGLHRDGTRFPVEISLAPLDTDEGMLVSAAIRDITERKQAEETLAAARDEAVAAAQLKSQFVAMVSHEIRTPMNGVLGLTALLLDTALQSSQRRYAEGIQTSAKALLTIINDILDFSKIEAGKVTLVEADFDLAELLEEVVRVAYEAARDKTLEILSYYPPTVPLAVRGDRGRVRQVLLNLTSNAVKFTPAGEVVVRVEPAAGGAADGARPYTFSVTDTGIGIAPADQARLFTPFTQADATTSRRFGGTGLGLTISRQLVELMGGRLEVASRPGHGSRFSFAIPLLPWAAAAGRSRGDLTGRRLLVVDDNRTGRRMLAEHATAWGMTAATAADAGTALEMLRAAAGEGSPYAAVVLDQQMPGGGGIELAQQAAADPAIPTPAFVLLWSGPYADDRLLPAVDTIEVLPKPVGPSALYNCLGRLLDPVVALAARRAAVPAGPGRPVADRGLVLLAEDNEINQIVAVDTLASLGWRADVAGNGIEAVRLGGTGTYRAILMDCQMPRMDGFEATRELRRRERPGQHTPIIAMTAGALAEDRQRCLAAGMDDYLAKPIDPDDLRTALDRWTTPEPTPAAGPGQVRPAAGSGGGGPSGVSR